MLENYLEEIGLNEKEARVYLASLELGQSVVQKIAQKAGINRATAYFVIEGLIKMGLISSFQKDKKQFFVAADPDKLIDVLDQKKEEIEKRKTDLKKILPQLQSIDTKQKDRPVVKYYEGKEGLLTMSEELLKKAQKNILMAYSVDAVSKIFSETERKKAKIKRIKKNVKTKVIYTYKDGVLKSTKDGKRRKVPLDKFPLNCDIAIYNDFVRIASLGKRLTGIVIEDKDVADSFRSIFELAWEASKKYQEKK